MINESLIFTNSDLNKKSEKTKTIILVLIKGTTIAVARLIETKIKSLLGSNFENQFLNR